MDKYKTLNKLRKNVNLIKTFCYRAAAEKDQSIVMMCDFSRNFKKIKSCKFYAFIK